MTAFQKNHELPAINPYDLARVPETAERMIKRYSTTRVAAEMAGYHACDFSRNSRQAIYWNAVRQEIIRQTHAAFNAM